MKGQAAFEFLTSYGLMFLILIASISTLLYFGVLRLENFNPHSCTIEPELYCDEYKVSANGTLYFSIRNNFQDLEYVHMNVTSVDCTLVNSEYTAHNVKHLEYMNQENNNLVMFTCTEPLIIGEPFTANMEFSFVKKNFVIEHHIQGKLITQVE